MGDEEVRQAQQTNTQKAEKPVKQKAAEAPVKKEDKKEEAQEKTEEAKPKPKKVEEESKIIEEREYIVPLRREWLKVPVYKRANKAVKALKEFIAQHMKVYDRDLRKVKVDILVNNEIRFRGMKKPLSKIKVRAVKRENGIVDVKLVDIPKHIEFELARKAKKEAEKAKKAKAKPAPVAKTEEKKEEADKETKEKEEASKEAMKEMEKTKAKEAKHTAAKKAPVIQRKALAK